MTNTLERLVWALYQAHPDQDPEARADVAAEMRRLGLRKFYTNGTVRCSSCGMEYKLFVALQGDTVRIDDGLEGWGCTAIGCNY